MLGGRNLCFRSKAFRYSSAETQSSRELTGKILFTFNPRPAKMITEHEAGAVRSIKSTNT